MATASNLVCRPRLGSGLDVSRSTRLQFKGSTLAAGLAGRRRGTVPAFFSGVIHTNGLRASSQQILIDKNEGLVIRVKSVNQA